MKKELLLLLLFIFISFSILFESCKEEELEPSIFKPIPELDKDAFTYKFDSFLVENFRKPYNLRFVYRLPDVGYDMTYNIIPTTYSKSKQMSVLVKYLFLDVLRDKVDPELCKRQGFRIMQLVGSSAINPFSQTEEIGSAESGVKISLLKVNLLDVSRKGALTDGSPEWFMKTLYHEYSHVLHQTKIYPPAFRLISTDYYVPDWNDDKNPLDTALALGFVSRYARASFEEDFVETIAHYIVFTDGNWQELLREAREAAKDTIRGSKIILQKLEMCRNYLKDTWQIDIDVIHKEFRRKMEFIKPEFVDDLMKQAGIY